MSEVDDVADSAMDALKALGGSGQAFDDAPALGGRFWRSQERIVHPRRTASVTPAGLHLGCGLATIEADGAELGGFRFHGAGLTAMICPPGEGAFVSRLPAQTARAAGLFVAWADLRTIAGGPLAGLMEELSARRRLQAVAAPSVAAVARLCAPFDPWYQGAARALAAEARALDLAALVLGSLAAGPGAGPASRHRHARKASAARDLLDGRLDDPPTLDALARAVGLNVRSLTEAFRASFGCSIAAYVTTRRLDTAALLLEQGMGPTEAAHRVGYSPTHFSVAFRRQFGVAPGRFCAAARPKSPPTKP